MSENIIGVIITAIGGALASFLSFYLGLKKSKNDDKKSASEVFTLLIERLNEENTRLKQEVAEIKQRLNSLENDYLLLKQREAVLASQNKELNGKIILLESTLDSFPFPQWLKDVDLKMIHVSKEYEKVFLKPINKTTSDYIGKKDEEIFPKELAEAWKTNDLYVLNTGNYWVGRETIDINYRHLGQDWLIIKWRKEINGIVTGISGIAIPIKHES